MKKPLKLIITVLLGYTSFILQAQNEWHQDFFLPTNSQRIFTDNLSNIYLQQNKELVKYNAKGQEKNRFSNKLLGQASSIDVTNPMKIVVYFADLTQILFLDNTLSQQAEPIALEESGFEQTQLVCYSYNNGIWLYDLNTFELIRLNENLEVTHRTGNINQVIGKEIVPVYLTERNNQLFVCDPNHGILVFDVFGTYVKTVPVKEVYRVDVVAGNIYYTIGQKLFQYNTKTLKEKEIALPENKFLQVEVNKDNLYLLTETGVKVYSYKN